MAKKASQFIFRKDYEKWLLKQGVKSVGAYCPKININAMAKTICI